MYSGLRLLCSIQKSLDIMRRFESLTNDELRMIFKAFYRYEVDIADSDVVVTADDSYKAVAYNGGGTTWGLEIGLKSQSIYAYKIHGDLNYDSINVNILEVCQLFIQLGLIESPITKWIL